MRLYVLMSLLAIMLSGANDSDNPSEDIFGPFVNGYTTTCTLNDMTRKVRVHYRDNDSHVPCEVRYSKPTEMPEAGHRVLWHAHNTEGYCERKARLFVGRLEGWGWQCGAPKWSWVAPSPEAESSSGSSEASDSSETSTGSEANESNETSTGSEASTGSGANETDNSSSASRNECDLYGGFYCN